MPCLAVLIDASNVCDFEGVICSPRFDTLEEAEAYCNPVIVSCNGTDYEFPRQLQIAFANLAGPCAGTWPATIVLTYHEDSSSWETCDADDADVLVGPSCYANGGLSITCFEGSLVAVYEGAVMTINSTSPVNFTHVGVNLQATNSPSCAGGTNCCVGTTADITITPVP